MSSLPALREGVSTLPEESGWFQPLPITSPDIEFAANAFSKQIQRELFLERAAVGTRSILPAKIETTGPDLQTSGINRAIRRTFPHALVAPDVSLQPLQEWEGYVLEVGQTEFSARLVDRTARNVLESEIADFPIADVSDDDRPLLTVGGVFRWVIGYERSRGGTKRRVSQVTFRRMPAWSRKELKQAESTAKHLTETLAWD